MQTGGSGRNRTDDSRTYWPGECLTPRIRIVLPTFQPERHLWRAASYGLQLVKRERPCSFPLLEGSAGIEPATLHCACTCFPKHLPPGFPGTPNGVPAYCCNHSISHAMTALSKSGCIPADPCVNFRRQPKAWVL